MDNYDMAKRPVLIQQISAPSAVLAFSMFVSAHKIKAYDWNPFVVWKRVRIH